MDFGGNNGFAMPAVAVRRGPPHPLGEDAKFFPYSATTPQSKSHPSDLQLRIKLPPRRLNTPHRSGELIEGTVVISRPGGVVDSTPIRVRSLTLQAYFESRTLFWHFVPAQKTDVGKLKAKYVPGAASTQAHELSIAHEVHRGLVPHENIEFSWDDGRAMTVYLDELGEDGVTPVVTLPFALRIPARVKVDECNHYPGAPRDLCPVERAPPPSFPESPFGSVQWILEVVLRLNTGVETVKVAMDERLFKMDNPATLVSRVVFPLLPADLHAQDLAKSRYFGTNINVDPFGAMISWEGKAEALDRLNGRGGEWRTYAKIVRLNTGKVISAEATLVAELTVPFPPIIQRSAACIPLVLAIRLETPNSTSKSILSKRTLRDVLLTRAMISIKRQLSTRGGKDVVPHTELTTVRSDALFPAGRGEQQEGSSKNKGGLVITANDDEAVVWEMEFDLQTESLMNEGRSATKPNIKGSTLVPSFRTPNIQLEYILHFTILIDGHGEYFIATFPIQFIAGDSAELPSFEEATGGVNGRDDSRPSLPPAYEGAIAFDEPVAYTETAM